MRINSDEAIAQARRDFRRYGSWFNVMAAATRREDGVLVLPSTETPAGRNGATEAAEPSAARNGGRTR